MVYGEGYGHGIQKNGKLYSATKKFIVFNVRVVFWWLSDENKFVNTLEAVKTQHWTVAAAALLDSSWFHEVGSWGSPH